MMEDYAVFDSMLAEQDGLPEQKTREERMKALKRATTTWRKGQPTPNSGGKPLTSIKNLAQYARSATNDGKELVDFMVDVLRGNERVTTNHKIQAVAWLADRGWGKPIQQVDIEAHTTHTIDLSEYSAEQLAGIIDLADKVVEEQKAQEALPAFPIYEGEYRDIDDDNSIDDQS